MKKSIFNLGKALNKADQQQVNGGRRAPYNPWDLCEIPEDYFVKYEECDGWVETRDGHMMCCH